MIVKYSKILRARLEVAKGHDLKYSREGRSVLTFRSNFGPLEEGGSTQCRNENVSIKSSIPAGEMYRCELSRSEKVPTHVVPRRETS